MTDLGLDVSPSVARLVADAADAFQARRARGEDPDPEEYAHRHPEAAAAIRGVLGVLRWAPVAVPAPAPAPPPPPRILGDFQLLREVGRGGMGVVYEAHQISLGRRVALKVLPFAALVDDRLLQRFQTEARAAAGLNHPHVAQVFAVGQDRGVHYIAMQFIDGRPLSDLIRTLHGAARPAAPAGPTTPTVTFAPDALTAPHEDGPAAAADRSTVADVRTAAFFRQAADLARQAAVALDHAHEAGVVHRDVKPGNLLIDGGGHLWVSDFGLAKMAASDAGLTRTGDVFGTLRYMSPEQALGQNDRVDHRTDVYALGATLYELLTGKPVVTATEKADIQRQIVNDQPVPPRRRNRAIPADLEAVCLKCLEKDPRRRYTSAGELAADLNRWLDGRPTLARPLGLWGRSVRGVRRRRGAVLVGSLLAACLASAGTAVYLGMRPPAKAEAEPAKVDEGAALRRLEADLVRGEKQTLIGATGKPDWHKWVVGRGRGQDSQDVNDFFTAHIQGCGLIELVPDPMTDQYVFSAQVRHDRGVGYSRAGIYVGRVTYPRAPQDLHFLVELVFNSVRGPWPGPGRTNPVELALHLLAEEAGPPNVYLKVDAVTGPDVPALDFDNGRWFDLTVCVTPAGISATFDGDRLELPLARLEALLTETLPIVLRRHAKDPAVQAVRPAFNPRGGLGVQVRYGAVAVRRVTLEPLAPRP